MHIIDLGKSGLKVPTVAVGCMRISNMNEREVSAFIDAALSNGANFFDHADIYMAVVKAKRFLEKQYLT